MFQKKTIYYFSSREKASIFLFFIANEAHTQKFRKGEKN